MILGRFWSQFTSLLAGEPRLIGIITADLGAGRYRVQLLDGGIVQGTTSGTYVVSDRVFITGTTIESKAPALSPIEIEV